MNDRIKDAGSIVAVAVLLIFCSVALGFVLAPVCH